MFFPKIIWLALALLTSWNTFYETSFNLFLYVLLCGVILLQIRQSLSILGRGTVWLFIPIVTLILFSTKNWENWLVGLQITYALSFLCAISGLFLLCEPKHKIGSLVGAFLLGFVSTHSFSFGLAYWPVGFIPLILWKGVDRWLRLRYLLAWAAFSAIGYLSFFYGYGRITDPAHSMYYASKIYDVALFAVSLIGSPLDGVFDIIHLPRDYFFIGFFVFVFLFFGSVAVIIRFAREPFAVILPFFCVILYATLSALLIAMGRSGVGIGPAFWNRYSTVADLAWLSLIILMVMAVHVLLSVNKSVSRAPVLMIPVLLIACLCYLTSVVCDSVNGVKSFKKHHNDMHGPYIALICSEESDNLSYLFPWSLEYLHKQVKIIKRLKLSVFADSFSTHREKICSERESR